MNPLYSLAQFRDVVTALPPFAPREAPAAHPRIALFAAAATAADIDPLRDRIASMAPPAIDADLRVYELDLDHPAAALDEAEAVRAITYGMMVVEPGVDLLCLAALTETPAVITGSEPLLGLRDNGRDIAALFGVLVAARRAQIPVLLAGSRARAAAALLDALRPGAASHATMADGEPPACFAAYIRLPVGA